MFSDVDEVETLLNQSRNKIQVKFKFRGHFQEFFKEAFFVKLLRESLLLCFKHLYELIYLNSLLDFQSMPHGWQDPKFYGEIYSYY